MQNLVLFAVGIVTTVISGWNLKSHPFCGYVLILGIIVSIMAFVDVDEPSESDDPQGLG